MADISLIPQNRIKDLSTTFDGCVHKTGNETVAGNKTFSGTTTFTTTPYVYKANTSELILKSSTADTTVTPESNYQIGHYIIADKNTKIGGYWYCEKRNDGGIRNGLETRKYSDDGSSYNHSALQVWRNKYDEGYLDFGASGTNLSVSGVDSSTTSTMVPTKGWVNNPETSTNVVHRSGDENIAGTKTFVGNTNDDLKMIISNTSGKNCRLQLRDSTTTYGDSGIEILQATSNNFNQFLIRFMNGNKYPFHIDQDTSDSSIFNTYINNKRLASFVTTTYQSGTSWYRIYSDGWIEQGGARDSAATDGYVTITFHKPFANTNYTFMETTKANGASTGNVRTGVMIYTMSTTNVQVEQDSYVDAGGLWYACGY